MKKSILKAVGLTVVAVSLAACGNLSNVSRDGTTDAPVFPKLTQTKFNHDGTQVGSWVNWDNVRQIEQGMNKDQIANLLGRPHFSEGLYMVREWDYAFNYRENGEHKICQYKILFDKNMNAQQFFWFPNGCNSPVNFTLSGDFLFDFDKDTLTANGQRVVADLADKLKDLKAEKVTVEGHTDRMGSVAYNLDLSQRRADRVTAKLKELGVVAQFTSVGLGKAHQVKHCEGSDQAAKDCLRENRRVEVKAEGKRIMAGSSELKAGQVGPSPLYEKGYPFNLKDNPYPKIPAMNLQGSK